MLSNRNSLFAFLLLFLMWSIFPLCGQDEVSVSANVEAAQAFENYPLVGLLTVTHNPQDRVDITSVKLEDKPLRINLIKTVSLSDKLQISMYRFQLPAKSRGRYTLPEITVKVGEKEYRSLPSYYNVTAATKPAQLRKTSPADKAVLLLEAAVEGPKTVYPGQKLRLIYRFGFRGDIALTKEELPLLEAKGFRKLGEKIVKEYVAKGFNIHEVIQEVEAMAAGTFSYPPAIVEGYAYEEDPVYKKRTYIEPVLHAESTPVTIEVAAFPPGKPSSFTGAVGQFSFKTQLLSSHEIPVESRVRLELEIESKDPDSLATVTLPDLKALPGLQGLFRLGDLPSVGLVRGSTKRFTVELYALSSEVKEIPSIEFSYFDPNEEKYVQLHSLPIPITVTLLAVPFPSEELKTIELPIPPAPPHTIYQLNAEDLKNFLWGSWSVFFLIPVAFLVLVASWFLRCLFPHWIAWQKESSSQRLWKQLQWTSPKGKEFFSLLNKIFILKLYELGKIRTADVNPEELPKGKVRTFLEGIQEARFTGKEISEKGVLKEAKKLLRSSNIWLFLAFICVSGEAVGVEEVWKQADAWYEAGESAHLLPEFKANFNHALSLYTQLETTYQPSYGNGKLYYNLGNTYFQLGEYPLAIFYYLRANALMPRELKVVENLNEAFSQLGLASYPQPSWIAFSLSEELGMFALTTGALTASILLLFFFRHLKKVCLVLSVLWLILLLHLGYMRYISPVGVVVLHPTLLYVEAKETAGRVSAQPVLPGSIAHVLMILDEGRWLKIQAPSGDVGYVPYTAVRIV